MFLNHGFLIEIAPFRLECPVSRSRHPSFEGPIFRAFRPGFCRGDVPDAVRKRKRRELFLFRRAKEGDLHFDFPETAVQSITGALANTVI